MRAHPWTPLVLAVALGLFLLALEGLRLWRGDPLFPGVAAVAAYLAWLAIEVRLVSVREASLPEATEDKGSCETYAVAQGLTVVLALLLPGEGALPAAIAGLALLVAGVAFRVAAIAALGRFYSRRVRLVVEHRVITSGPYRLVRHPAYLGTLAGHLGFALALRSWPALLTWAALFVPLVVRRILVEEPLLLGLPGYAAYAERHKRLVPGVW